MSVLFPMKSQLRSPHLDEHLHFPATNHAFFIRGNIRVITECEATETPLFFGQSFTSLRPDIRLDTTTAHSPDHSPIFKNEQLGPRALWGRTRCRDDGRHGNPLVVRVRLRDLPVNFALG